MRHWTRRFTLQYSKVGQALNASKSEINKDFLHENIRGILLAETSGLTSSEFASVLATSGTTSAEGESIGNSWKFSHIIGAFCTQWGDAALAARDAKARKSEAVVAAMDNFDLSGLSEAASRIENATSRNDADQQINEYGDDDDENYEEDADWYTGDCDDEFDETAYTIGTPTDDPELLEHFDGNLEDAHASAFQVYASASRSFQQSRELLARVKSARGYFPVVGIGAFDGLAQPPTHRKLAKSRGKGKKGKRQGKSSSQKCGRLAKTTDLTCRVTLLVFVSNRASEFLNKRKATCIFTWQIVIWYLCFGLCSVRFTVLWRTCRGSRTRSRRGGH